MPAAAVENVTPSTDGMSGNVAGASGDMAVAMADLGGWAEGRVGGITQGSGGGRSRADVPPCLMLKTPLPPVDRLGISRGEAGDEVPAAFQGLGAAGAAAAGAGVAGAAGAGVS